jgi:hypothetical protein
MRDPDHVKPICKHLAAAMDRASGYRLASEGWDLSGPLLSPYSVAFRYAAKLAPRTEDLSNYARLRIVFDLSKSVEMDKILSVAAKVSQSIPFVTRNKPHEISIDLPVDASIRSEVGTALKRLPFVKSVIGDTGGRIRG